MEWKYSTLIQVCCIIKFHWKKILIIFLKTKDFRQSTLKDQNEEVLLENILLSWVMPNKVKIFLCL